MACTVPYTVFPLEGINIIVVLSLLIGNKLVSVMGKGFCQKELHSKEDQSVGVWSDTHFLSV